jgi:antitoxin component YwqK of YwqJK toxin-antitoxin module
MITNFAKGQQVGLTKVYARNGKINSIRNYVNDTLQGRNDIFTDRALRKTYYYNHGDLNGPYKVYYSDGTLQTEGFYIGDDIFGKRRTYSQTGKLSFVDDCFKGITMSTDIYNSKGEKENTVVYANKTGTFSHTLNSGMIVLSYGLKNGILDGKYTRKDKFNKLLTEAEYKSGSPINTYKEYGPYETIKLEQTYYNGDLNGMTKNYDLVGNLRTTSETTFGNENGKTIRYYHNKVKMFEYSELEDIMEGDLTYYNQKGEALVKVTFLNGAPLYYMKKSKTGQLDEKVEIVNETGTIISNYPNGKVAIKYTYEKGSKEGDFVINNELGKPEYVAFYKNDVVHNDRIEYYANGNIYLKEHFVDNDYEGLQEYFKEDGKPWLKAEYKNDELHGKVQIFTNGVLTTTKKYDSDFLVEIIK